MHTRVEQYNNESSHGIPLKKYETGFISKVMFSPLTVSVHLRVVKDKYLKICLFSFIYNFMGFMIYFFKSFLDRS